MGNPVEHECDLVKCSPDQVITRCFSRYGDLYIGNETDICSVNYCGICGHEYKNPSENKNIDQHSIFRACRSGKFFCHRSLLFGTLLFSSGYLSTPVKRCPFCGLRSDEDTTSHY